MTEEEKVIALLKILQRQDDRKLPKFCEALKETDQRHVIKILKRNGEQQQERASLSIVCLCSLISCQR